jgi:hypothetical protein
MNATGEAALTTLQKVSVSVAYDDLYEVTLSKEDSTALANAFTVSGGVKEGGATFTATLSNSVVFREVLAGAMAAAICVEQNSDVDPAETVDADRSSLGLTLDVAINHGMLNQFRKIYTDSLPNILESDWAMSSSVEWAAGALDMADKLDDAECEILAQQLPESNYELYMDTSENPVTDALSLKGNDSVIFVFEVNQSGVVRAITKSAGVNPDVGATAVAGGNESPYGYNQNVNTYLENSRRVAFKLNLKNLADNDGALDNLRA